MPEQSTAWGPLSVPMPLTLSAAGSGGDTQRRSWIQLIKTGTFQSARYGEFGISSDDLRRMLHNFRHITPIAPTELPVDYDHLSMQPVHPGDGKAAGWLKAVELRGQDDELWGLVEWTPDAARQIANREYQFVSPSFAKDHVHNDGRRIGPTLLAAAITNHPFLQGMAALTLSRRAALPHSGGPHMFEDDKRSSPSRPEVIAQATAFARRVRDLMLARTPREAISLASTRDAPGAAAYRLAGGHGLLRATDAVDLSRDRSESFETLVKQYATEHGVSFKRAIHVVGAQRPDLAISRR
jgi:hypothetical protein